MLIIDGNNLLGYYGRDRSPENIDWIIKKLKTYQKNQKIKLYFDGLSPFGEDKYNTNSKFQIIWVDKSYGKEADDEIIGYVRSMKTPKEATVISNDKRIIMEVAGFSQTLSAKEFIEKIEGKFISKENISIDDEKEESLRGIDKDALMKELLNNFKK